MSSRRWFGSTTKDRFTIEYLQHLCSHLVKYKEGAITEGNKGGLVEILREIAELMIWGDQHNPAFFDYFLEKNILSYFLGILGQDVFMDIKIQLIQTLSIMLQNINSDTSVYYLLSNNHINSLIGHKFDFHGAENEELLAYYISFLKTLSLKLNRSTLHFYFNERAQNFPLYTEAIKFFNHKESMVRIAARTLTLNVYRVEDAAMRKFILDEERAPYFHKLAVYVRDQYLYLDTLVLKSTYFDHNKLDEILSEQIDLLYYLQDIFGLGIPELSEVMTRNLLQHFLLPILVESLKPAPPGDRPEGRISPLLALFVVAHMFFVFDHGPLVNQLLSEILMGSSKNSINSRPPSASDATADRAKGKKSRDRRHTEQANRYDFRDTLFSYLISSDERIVLATLCVFLAIFKNNSVDKDILEAAGMLPAKRRKARLLMAALTMSDAGSSVLSDESPKTAAGVTPHSEVSEGIPSENRDDIPADEKTGSERPETPVRELSPPIKAVSSEDGDIDHVPCFPSKKSISGPPTVDEPKKEKQSSFKEEYPQQLVGLVMFILERHPPCRLVTLQAAINLVMEMTFRGNSGSLSSEHMQIVKDAYSYSVEQMRSRITGQLGDIFVDLVLAEEKEARRQTRLESIVTDPLFLLPVSSNPLSGIPLSRRLPCGEVENTRKVIQMFLVLRMFRLQLCGETEEKLPIERLKIPAYRDGDFVELTNRDVIACAIFVNNRRLVRYLVADGTLLILVEPDQTRIGWAAVRLVEVLLNVDANVDKGDKRVLHVTVRLPQGSGRPQSAPPQQHSPSSSSHQESLNFTLFFDDPIRCVAAKQYMDVGRAGLRQHNIVQLNSILETEFNDQQ